MITGTRTLTTILKDIASKKPNTQCAKRATGYMELRHHYEDILRCEFMKKGGNIQRQSPHYMVVEHSPWLASWFEHSTFIKINIDKFDKSTISFTYGDSHPTFSPKVNDGKYGPERYIEAHVWGDSVIKRYM